MTIQTSEAQPDGLANIQALIDAAANAPGERTQALEAIKVSDAFGEALSRFAQSIANENNISVDIHIGPKAQSR